MPQDWKTIRIFISSTFQDIHAERDHLVRFVFPELKEKCRAKRIHLIDVDLRWGVTESDVQDGKALDICLDEIDTCRPYFLGLLGHRYGWVPPGHEHSITAQEIYHGVLHNDIPKQILDRRRIIEGKLESTALKGEEIECFMRCYLWDRDKGKFLLRGEASPKDLETIRSVFRQYSLYQRHRSFFFLREESLTRELAGSNTADFFETDEAIRQKLADLKQEIMDSGVPCYEYGDLEGFGNLVRDILWNRIQEEIAGTPEEEKDWLAAEDEFHELFMADRTRRFVGRREILDRMHAFCEGTPVTPIMVVTGEPGSGKSALMAQFTEEAISRHPDWHIIPNFVGASPGSTGLRQTLRRISAHLLRITGSDKAVPEDIQELKRDFPELLDQACRDKRTVLVLDALNQFDKADNAHTLQWLPFNLPANVRLIISTLAGDDLKSLKARKPTPLDLPGLDGVEIGKLVKDYLREIRREFPNKPVEQAFMDKLSAGNPLYILVALEELRLFGRFEELADRVRRLPPDVPTLFKQVLERVEADFSPALVRDCMSLIACGKQGMTAEELQILLSHHAPALLSTTEPSIQSVRPEVSKPVLSLSNGGEHGPLQTQCAIEEGQGGVAKASRLPDMLWSRLYRSLAPYLFERSGVIDFFHGQLREAVERRYLVGETDKQEFHRIIADYFEKRWAEPCKHALDELPYHLITLNDWSGIETLLSDLFFIEKKCEGGMTYGLVKDYDSALARDDGSWTGVNRVKEFRHFVRSQAHIFRKNPEFAFQQAMNQPDASELCRAAWELVKSGKASRSWFKWISGKPAFVNPCTITLQGHSSRVNCCAMSQDGRHIISVSSDNILKVWDAKTGEELATTLGRSQRVPCSALTPDGRRIVSGSDSGTLKIWDVETGGELATLSNHEDSVDCCAIAPDGKLIVSGSDEGTFRIWDLETREELATLSGHSYWVNCCAIAPDGKRIVSGSHDGTIKIWDLETSGVPATFQDHSSAVQCCATTPDGKRIVSSSLDETLKIWDTETGKELAALRGHLSSVICCAITWDGKRIVSGSYDKALKIWDVETSREIAFLDVGEEVRFVDIGTTGSIKAVTKYGMVCVLSSEGILPDAPILTPVYVYRSESGQWDKHPTAACRWCGQRFLVDAKIIDAIGDIHRKAGFYRDVMGPLSALPQDAWDDPRLLSECPFCKRKLKFNPFVCGPPQKLGKRNLVHRRFCHQCGEPKRDNHLAEICTQCGSVLYYEDVAHVECPACSGLNNPNVSRYCIHCGVKLS